MTHNYENNVLTLIREDGATIVYPYNPETQQPFKSEQDALSYANSKPMYWVLPPTLEELKDLAIEQVKANSTAMSPVTINDITYNGGDSSASAISGAIQLAQGLGETDVKLWDVNNTIRTFTFEEAQTVAAQIAKAYRGAKFDDYQKIVTIKACTTIEELEAIEI